MRGLGIAIAMEVLEQQQNLDRIPYKFILYAAL